jgi:hypothetical protein
MVGAIIVSRIDVVKLGLEKNPEGGWWVRRLLGGEGNWVVVMLNINYLSSVDVWLFGEVRLWLPINN